MLPAKECVLSLDVGSVPAWDTQLDSVTCPETVMRAGRLGCRAAFRGATWLSCTAERQPRKPCAPASAVSWSIPLGSVNPKKHGNVSSASANGSAIDGTFWVSECNDNIYIQRLNTFFFYLY